MSVVLLIDPDMSFLAQAGMHVSAAGYTPLTARSAADAMRILGDMKPVLALWTPIEGEPPIELAQLPEGVPVRMMAPAFREWARAGGAFQKDQEASPGFTDCLRQHAETDAVRPPPEGELAKRPLADLIFFLIRQRLSAALTLRWAGGEGMPEHSWTLHFARGRLTGWSQNQDMTLADYLSGQELVSFARMRDLFAQAAKEGRGLVEILLAGGDGLPAPAAMRAALTGFAETVLAQPAVSAAGRYALVFAPAPVAPEIVAAVELGLRLLRRIDVNKLTVMLAGSAWVPRAYPLPVLPLDKLPLTTQEGYFFSQVDGKRTLDQIAAAGVLGKTGAWQAFAGCLLTRLASGFSEGRDLVYTGFAELLAAKQVRMLDVRGEAQRLEELLARAGSGNPYAVLGLPPQADAETARVRYESLRAELAQGKFPEELRQRYRSKLALLNARITDAYLTLVDAPPTRAEDDGQFRALEAVRLRQQAQREIQRGQRENAINLVQLSLQYDPAQPEAHHLLGSMLRDHPLPKRRVEAESHYKKALELAPDNPDFAAALALCYEEKKPQQAARLVQQHLQKHPRHSTLRELDARLRKFLTNEG